MTQVVPFPGDHTIPLVARYQQALRVLNADVEPGFVSLEGYMVGRLTISVLDSLGNDVTRDAFLNQIAETGVFDLGGISLTYALQDNQGMDDVFLTVIQPDGRFKAVERLAD